MARTLEIITPEQVAIHYDLAGVGSRGVAAALDALGQLLIYLILALIGLMLAALDLFTFEEITHVKGVERSLLIAIATLVIFAVYWGYYIAFETLWNGETPGKRIMGLRTIKEGGYPVDFRSVLIRNLLRPVDALPGIPGLPLYGIGCIATMAHVHYKRLGDMAAGTLVVRHGQAEEEQKASMGEAVVYRLLDANVISQISRLTREEYRMIKQFLERRMDLPIPLRDEFALRLAGGLIEKFAYQPPALGMDYTRWLEELELAYRQRTLGITATPATPNATAPQEPQPTAPAAPSDMRKW